MAMSGYISCIYPILQQCNFLTKVGRNPFMPSFAILCQANQNCFFWNRGFDQQAGLTKIKNLTSIVAGLENLNLPQNAKPNWMILDGFNSLDPSHGLSSHGGYPRPDAALLSLGEVIREPMMVVVTRAFVLKVFLYSKTIDLG